MFPATRLSALHSSVAGLLITAPSSTFVVMSSKHESQLAKSTFCIRPRSLLNLAPVRVELAREGRFFGLSGIFPITVALGSWFGYFGSCRAVFLISPSPSGLAGQTARGASAVCS